MGALIRCVVCEESGKVDGETCEECDGKGHFKLEQCPREFVGPDITEAINVASVCVNGILPVSGGLMAQSAWFVSLWNAVQNEQNAIDAELAKRDHGW